MLVATLMVIAVSGYAAEKVFKPILTEDFNNYSDGNIGNWGVWGNNNPSYHIVDSDVDGGGMHSVDKPFRNSRFLEGSAWL